MNWKLTAAERSAIRAAADQRGVTATELIRQGLRAQGVPLRG